jgi:cobalt-zinc-cadmium efflux system outer membrane protein
MGCGNVPREAGFGDVQQILSDRIDAKVHWNQGEKVDEQVAAEVRNMLSSGGFSVDEAVQIALLNNRNLQAMYEDLMIAQADLVEAGLLENPIFDAEVLFAESGGTGLELSVAQSFLSIFQIPLRKAIAENQFEAAKLKVAGAGLAAAANVRMAFHKYVAALQLLELRQTALSAMEASYEFAQRMHEAGNITDRELMLERAAYEEAKLAVADAEYLVIAMRPNGRVPHGWRILPTRSMN